MNDDIKVRYIQWEQKIDKLNDEITKYNSSKKILTDAVKKINNFTKRLNSLRLELEDIVVWDEVEDFLENGSGLLTTPMDMLQWEDRKE